MIDVAKIDAENQLYYLPIIDENLTDDYYYIANNLRSLGYNVQMGLDKQGLGKALDYGSKINATFVVIFGENEKKDSNYLVKDMRTGDQQSVFYERQ